MGAPVPGRAQISTIKIPKELAKWVKMGQMEKVDASKLTQRMKNPMVGAPKHIPRIPEIMAWVRVLSLMQEIKRESRVLRNSTNESTWNELDRILPHKVKA